ncbi:MAG: hypothetical protein PHN64_04575 [Desulfovibrionaceae bacterium]|nr:hypothetical protein [Desulfovibrionaceae bacterium]
MYTIPSRQFLAQIQKFEGFYAQPYLCPAGKVTIGYGTNLEAHPENIPYNDLRKAVENKILYGNALLLALKKRGMQWTKQQAESNMLVEVLTTREDLEKRCPAYISLVARDEMVRAEALLDMAYNMGVGTAPRGTEKGRGLLGFFTFLPRMERGEYEAAAAGLKRSSWYKQVGRRSRTICEQIRTGAYCD